MLHVRPQKNARNTGGEVRESPLLATFKNDFPPHTHFLFPAREVMMMGEQGNEESGGKGQAGDNNNWAKLNNESGCNVPVSGFYSNPLRLLLPQSLLVCRWFWGLLKQAPLPVM